ncbi:MAG: aspartate/glutamate racemase family protein [Planctomycetota bacterium]
MSKFNLVDMDKPAQHVPRVLLLTLLIVTIGVAADVVAHTSAHPDGRVAFSFDASAWKSHDDMRRLPIGVFDSGIGGLTVMEALLKLDVYNNETRKRGADGVPDFAQERFIYFGDQANMPYGQYPAAERTDFLRELILKDAVFLLGRRAWPAIGNQPTYTKLPVKAIVIACNTATAYGLDDIRAAVATWKIPVVVVGVVEAGARAVLSAEYDGGIGVLATVGTCASGAYPRTITSTLGLAGHSVPLIVQQGSATLAGVIEGNAAFPEPVSTYVMREVRALADTYRAQKPTKPLAAIVLGCTHFPLIERELATAFTALRAEPGWSDLIAEHLVFVNPAEATALELYRLLAHSDLRLKSGQTCDLVRDQFYISVPRSESPGVKLAADGSLDRDYKYTRQPGNLEREDTKNVPMTPATLPESSVNLLRNKLHEVWKRLGGG